MNPQTSSRRKPGPRFLAATLITLSTFATITHAEPIAITTAPIPSFQSPGIASNLGPLEWRGGIELKSDDQNFGGLSGLSLSRDCTQLLAVADTGHWFKASLQYEEGHLAGVTHGEWAPMRDDKDIAFATKSMGDAEALTNLGKGRYAVGFERTPRIGFYNLGRDGLNAGFRLIPSPKAITEGPVNGELEAVGKFHNGPWADYFLAISEENFDSHGDTLGWLWKSWRSVPFSVKRHGDYKITDAAILPSGDVLILERSFGPSLPPGMAIARIPAKNIKPGATLEPTLLFEGRAPAYTIDNMEGVALCRKDGETRLTLVSDNNLDPLQRTLLLQFALK
jgi:hypothetical protein